VKRVKRSKYGAKAKIPDDPALRQAFNDIQGYLSNPRHLVHHNTHTPLIFGRWYFTWKTIRSRFMPWYWWSRTSNGRFIASYIESPLRYFIPDQAEHQLTIQKWLKRALCFPVAKSSRHVFCRFNMIFFFSLHPLLHLPNLQACPKHLQS